MRIQEIRGTRTMADAAIAAQEQLDERAGSRVPPEILAGLRDFYGKSASFLHALADVEAAGNIGHVETVDRLADEAIEAAVSVGDLIGGDVEDPPAGASIRQILLHRSRQRKQLRGE